MPGDIRSFFGGGAAKKTAEPTTADAKPDPRSDDAKMHEKMEIDLTDDVNPPPSSGEKRKAPEEAVDVSARDAQSFSKPTSPVHAVSRRSDGACSPSPVSI